MNKTININLGGYFFHIDENAFQKLKRYLDSIAKSLNDDPQGKDEIIADIEARISELFSEKIKDIRQVINDKDIDEVVAIMGQPEDFAEAEEGYTDSSQAKATTKKLFRDGYDKFLGGVCSGLGHYTKVDTIWVRLIFLVLTLAGSGLGIIVYIVLWILLPEAKTTAEKLQMEGEAVNIDNIEKKIRADLELVSEKIKNGASDLSDKISHIEYKKLRNKTQSGIQDLLNVTGKILSAVFKVFAKIMGAVLLVLSGIILISLLFALFSAGSLELLNIDNKFVKYPPFFYNSILPEWLLLLFGTLAVGIPFLALLVLGLRILSPRIKKMPSKASLSLLGVWIISLLGIGFSGIEYTASRAYDGVKTSKKTINYNPLNPLKISFKNNNDIYYSENLRYKNNAIEIEVNNKKVKYSNNVQINVKKSETDSAYVQIKKESEGKKHIEAFKNAEKIDYKFNIKDNKIIFNSFFLSELKNIWKDEEVRVTVYIPENTSLFFESSSKRFLNNIDNLQDIYAPNMTNHHFKMTAKGLECTDCEVNIYKNSNEEKTATPL